MPSLYRDFLTYISDYYRIVSQSGRRTRLIPALDANSTSIEAFSDIENSRLTVIDNGNGITPDDLSSILKSIRSPINFVSAHNSLRKQYMRKFFVLESGKMYTPVSC